ncbi:MAG: hypothetical protein GT597_13910 [Bacteroidales bacterium]|jgi:hypothetical protein|nr:hypothetical protein [Bacteroidales bacterium]
MATKVKGYELTIKIGTKLITGLITTGFKIKPNYEEILHKEMGGVPVEDIIDADYEFTASGQAYLATTAEQPTHIDFEDLREMAPAGTSLAFVYGRFVAGSRIVSGNAKIQDYGEDANSKDTATFSVTFKANKGSVTFGDYTP